MAKMFRMLRLAKMLRISRVKVLLERHLDEHLKTLWRALSVVAIVLSSLFLSHVLGCIWIYVGLQDDVVEENWKTRVGFAANATSNACTFTDQGRVTVGVLDVSTDGQQCKVTKIIHGWVQRYSEDSGLDFYESVHGPETSLKGCYHEKISNARDLYEWRVYFTVRLPGPAAAFEMHPPFAHPTLCKYSCAANRLIVRAGQKAMYWAITTITTVGYGGPWLIQTQLSYTCHRAIPSSRHVCARLASHAHPGTSTLCLQIFPRRPMLRKYAPCFLWSSVVCSSG